MGLYPEGLLSEGFLHLRFWGGGGGGLISGGLVFFFFGGGGAYYRNFTVFVTIAVNRGHTHRSNSTMVNLPWCFF